MEGFFTISNKFIAFSLINSILKVDFSEGFEIISTPSCRKFKYLNNFLWEKHIFELFPMKIVRNKLISKKIGIIS